MPIRITFSPDTGLPPVVHPPAQPEKAGDWQRKEDPGIPALPSGVKSGRKSTGLANDKEKDKDRESKDKDKLQEVLAELDSLIGLTSVKKLVREIEAYIEIQRRRTREKLNSEPLALHMIFRGNPGTGKTTVARIIGRLMKELGVLEKGHMVECERADMVGEYIGHTAQKTKEQVKKALGGVLFIDEAYSLARGGEKDFGKEAIDALVRAMENNRENLILILAGYSQEMEWFLQTNPGLRSRFPIHIDFPDYTLDELLAIGDAMFHEREYELTYEAKTALRLHLQIMMLSHPYSGNARLIRNLVEKTIRKQAVRLFARPQSTREELIRILPLDLTWDETSL